MAAGKGKASVLGQCLLQQLPFQESQPLPAPCPPVLHTADSTRHSPPPSRSPVVPGDPSRTRPRPCRRLSTAQRLAAISPSCSSNAFAAGAGQDIDRQPPSMSSLRLSRQREPPPGCSAQEAAFPSPQPFSSAPCATAPLTAALLPQFPQQQGSQLGDPAGSATSAPGLGAALPAAGHTWMAKPALPGVNRLSLSPCRPRHTHWVPLLDLWPHWDLALSLGVRPLCCCQGSRRGTRSGTAPRWLSQLVTVRGRGDDIPAPAKTNTAPSKHAGLGKSPPRPSITEPAVLQPSASHP